MRGDRTAQTVKPHDANAMNAAKAQEFRSQLLEMRDQLFHAVSHVQSALNDNRMTKGEISIVRTHLADMDSEGEDADLAVAQNERGILQAVDAALERIEHGTFGGCEECGREIGEARLKALPYTPYCIACAERRQG